MNINIPINGKIIQRFPKYYAMLNGNIWSTKTNKFLSGGVDSFGYRQYQLRKNNKTYRCRGHTLVLETFIGLCPVGLECRHLNSNPADNRLENLCWGTRKDNVQDSINCKTHICINNKGENNSRAKLTEQNVRTIIYIYKTKLLKQTEIAKLYNIDSSQINRIVNKKSWRYLWK